MGMTAAIIQARMASTRLPGKILKEVDGVPLLKYQLERVRRAKRLDKVVVATTNADRDNIIVRFCEINRTDYFRGAEEDVLGRYYQCARKYQADTIVRVTSDCPLSDPDIIDEAVDLFMSEKADYVSNTVPPESGKYPDGSDVEVFSMKALERANAECSDPHDREHVTFYFWRYDNGFKTAQLDYGQDFSNYRFTVDYPEDFEVVKFVIKELAKRGSFGHLEEIVDIIESNPHIKAKNARYYFGIGWKRSRA